MIRLTKINSLDELIIGERIRKRYLVYLYPPFDDFDVGYFCHYDYNKTRVWFIGSMDYINYPVRKDVLFEEMIIYEVIKGANI